jgi:hypothetical protein
MKRFTVAMMVALAIPTFALAQAEVQSGFTSVALDTATLSSAAGLDLSSVSPGIGAGVLPGSVAFPINARDAATLPTTFTYTPNNFPAGPFSGTIEHTGSVFFNADAVEVGDFTIGFNAARAVGPASGFYVASTTGVAAILFDTAVTSLGSASASTLDLTVDLLVSPEFATFLGNSALAGADVGDARILAAVPEPTSLSLLAVLSGVACMTRRIRG